MVQTISYAVFRARVLHGMKHFGIHYDDLEICNGQGVFKGGISKLQEQLNQVANYMPSEQNAIKIVNDNEVIVYPNPAINQVTVACKHARQILIYDLLGNTIITKKLNSQLNENKIDVSGLQSGMYVYKVVKQNNEIYTGKLTIE
jgi:hypothetical protein